MSKLIFKIHKPRVSTSPLTITFPYSLGENYFKEKLIFEDKAKLEIISSPIFERLLSLTAVTLGVSYYKLLAPFVISAPDIALSQEEQLLVKNTYENGLGEFFARNNLKRYGKIGYDFAQAKPLNEIISLKNRILLPIGGGKDSLVSVQLLEKANIDFTPFALNPKGPIISSIKEIAKQPIYVKRELDLSMIELGKQQGFYNGHVPSTAINSIIAALCALLYDYKYIALSNERSASEGNIEFDGQEVNHQYSKSLEFEKLLNNVLSKATGGGLEYFSLLRPFSEVKIANIFAKETRFDKVFSSCNKNFRLQQSKKKLWCGNCPKCHFTFLILAPNMDKARLINIFGENLLDNEKHKNAYKELSGLVGHKPWECVGEILEAAAMIYALSKDRNWANDIIISKLIDNLIKFYRKEKLEQALSDLMKDSNIDLIPNKMKLKLLANAK